MISIQIEQTNLLREKHNSFLFDFFNSIIENIYDLLIEYESNTNIYSSNIEPYKLKKCNENNFSNSIEIRHINYNDLNLISTNFENCCGLNVKRFFNKIYENLQQINTPFVVLKINTSLLKKYLGDDMLINNSYNNMSFFQENNLHKLKIYKYKNENSFYILIFFDSLNYNKQHIFNNHNVIENLDINDVNLFSEPQIDNLQTLQFNFNLRNKQQQIEEKYSNIFNEILDSTNRTEVIGKTIKNLIIEINSEREENERNLLIEIENIIERKFKEHKIK